MKQVLKGLALVAALTLSSFAHADEAADRWNSLVKTAAESKDITDLGDNGTYSSLARYNGYESSFQADQSHQSDYFSTVAFINQAGQTTGPIYIDVVSENWVLENNIWKVDQWLFRMSMTGKIAAFAHRLLVEDTDGRVLGLDDYKASREEGQAKWEALRNDWYVFVDKKNQK